MIESNCDSFANECQFINQERIALTVELALVIIPVQPKVFRCEPHDAMQNETATNKTMANEILFML